MKSFPNKTFIMMQSLMHQITGYTENMNDTAQQTIVDRDLLTGYAGIFEIILKEVLGDVEMPLTRTAVERLCTEFLNEDTSLTLKEVNGRVSEVQSRLIDEFESYGKFFYIPLSRAGWFEREEPFGPLVSKKFPKLTEDIHEAGKCYACARYTACVFHLMRVMEQSVQKLGKKLRVTIDVETETWQTILNHVNGEIKKMDAKKPRTKLYAEIAGHLYNAKVAWRNSVMHPKATYTEEEAENLLKQVGIFVGALAKAI